MIETNSTFSLDPPARDGTQLAMTDELLFTNADVDPIRATDALSEHFTHNRGRRRPEYIAWHFTTVFRD